VLREVGETETTQENIQDGLELDEGDPGFQLPVIVLNKGSTVMLFYLFLSALPILLNFPFICFLSFFLSFRDIFCFINPDDFPTN
jgi:hypothetical protein